MSEEKNDRRIRKTKKTLIEALTKLMAEKKTNRITVKELTQLADVNRSTFYIYYRDVFDMVEKVETEMLNDFTRAFYKCFTSTTNYHDLLSFFTYLFEFVQANAEICKILLGPDGEYSFLEKLKNMIQSQSCLGNDVLSVKLKYYEPFIVSGCIGVIQQWLDDDMKESPEEMASMIVDILHLELL